MTLAPVDNLLDHLLDARNFPDRPARYRVHGVWESRSTIVHYDITVDDDLEEWTARDLATQTLSTYRGGVVTTGADQSPSQSYRARVTNPALQLLFPEHLPVWGRGSRDTDAPIETERLDDSHTLVVLRSTQDPALRKTLVIDDRTGFVVRFYDALTVTVLQDLTVV
ncbi:hypothetical protein CLV49_1163 [Labedella gwakjiensis]|uniref:Uncharacterized protein n=1 Tax=Labedella gwakjiensis TaxID=390269 RepID=A0A2P8GUC0_9MICO|nr:hypothetical protein [Labedella gwakjiensis]PSL37556.1 hypothetical protein CLV49_1163 [Labedella gwakjiensis]RUQ84856.1 hypothetical protein ELQ93_14850 [Labedella gwakjiensis]